MAFGINIGFGTRIDFKDSKTVQFYGNQTSNCNYVVTALAIFDLTAQLAGLKIPDCNNVAPVISSDSPIKAIGKLQAQINCIDTGILSISVDDFSPLFTSAVSPGDNPTISFTPIPQNKNLVYASPDGIAGDPTFRALTANDLPALPYKVYVALLSQGGLNAPAPTMLENTLSELPTWSYAAAGTYFINTVQAVFTASKTGIFLSPLCAGGVFFLGGYAYISPTQLQIFTIDSAFHAVDDVLLDTMIEIRVYP